ncbi:hypothetical protein [Streptosporangium sp. NPDC004631]
MCDIAVYFGCEEPTAGYPPDSVYLTAEGRLLEAGFLLMVGRYEVVAEAAELGDQGGAALAFTRIDSGDDAARSVGDGGRRL